MAKTVDLSQLDSRMGTAFSNDRADVRYYDVREEPFRIYGLYRPCTEDVFKRIPDEVARATSKGVEGLYKCTAGGRVRFCTDSDHVTVKAAFSSVYKSYHTTLLMSAGFDLFLDDPVTGESIFYDVIKPPYDLENGYTYTVSFPDKRKRYITVNFPLYSAVSELYIGLSKDAELCEGAPYRNKKPVVFYGSSITQGACASRPSIAYTSIISRRFNLDYINLGFSGNGKAEDAIVDYMAGLDMSVFVSDYDHNAPDAEYLRSTHYKMYEKIRAVHPDIPYIMISRPDFTKKGTERDSRVYRRQVIINDFYRAYAELGDMNVYFIDGEGFFNGEYADCCTTDDCHPTDFGMVKMADTIGNVIRKLTVE